MSGQDSFDRIPTGLQFFDSKQDYTIAWKRLPHWAQAGTVAFITWRTADSLPREALVRLSRQRHQILKQHQIDPEGDWKHSLSQLPPVERGNLQWLLFTAWDEQLDAAAGACVLREPALSEIVMDSLLHFDSDRYVLTDAVVMPNHVHLLVAFREEDLLMTQCTSWKHFTATKINKWLRENLAANEGEASGSFWQVEQFDHLVRSIEEYDKYRRYIAENPEKAHLKLGSFRYYRRPTEEIGSNAN